MSPLVPPVPDVTNASLITNGLLQDSVLRGGLQSGNVTANTVTDWNNAVDTGWYRSSGAVTNAPAAVSCIGTVMAWSTTNIVQTVVQVTAGVVWQRIMASGSWGAWVNQAGVGASLMREYTLFHLGLTATYTVTPLTAGTVEPANAPMSRVIVDASACTQIRIAVGQRVIGAGATTCYGRVQYATNQATQTTWADANTSGTGIDLQSGSANILKAGAWLTLDPAAQVDPLYCRFVIITTGTLTTAPTIATAKVQFK